MRILAVLVLLFALAYFAWRYQREQQFVVSGGVPDSVGLGDFFNEIADFPVISDVVDTVSNTINSGRAEVIRKWADAIQIHEGWKPGSKSYRNNNPGNLRVAGDLGTDASGFGIFSTYDKGRAALESDLSAKLRKYPTWSILQIMSRYAPASDNNNVTAYANAVAAALGVSPQTTLGELA